MTSFWCFSIKRFGTRFAEAELFFSMKPFYSTNRVLSVHRARHGRHSSTRRFAGSLPHGLSTRLRLPRAVFFVSPTEPRMLKTLDATCQPPERGGLVSNSLVYRYNVEHTADGLKGEEGTFNICTFWLVEALTRAGQIDRNRLVDARLMYERMLGYANHLGLYAEETGPRGEALGNFPQAFTHLALISAAYNLDRALGRAHP